MQIDHLKPMGF